MILKARSTMLASAMRVVKAKEKDFRRLQDGHESIASCGHRKGQCANDGKNESQSLVYDS